MELHADGHPVGAPAAPVRHVHDGGRGGAGGREQAHGHHVAEEQEQPHSGGAGADDRHGGEGQGQHQVPRRDGVAHHQQGAGREVVEPRVELEEVGEHGQPLVGGARRDGRRQRPSVAPKAATRSRKSITPRQRRNPPAPERRRSGRPRPPPAALLPAAAAVAVASPPVVAGAVA